MALLVRAREIVTCETEAPQNGITFEALGRIDGGVVVIENGRVVAVGREEELADWMPRGAQEIDVRDCVLVPGFVDAHAHPLFAGDREADFTARLHGEKPPLGMLHTVRETRAALADPGAFYRDTVRPRLQMMLAHGTTTLETKTGYALTKEGEFALLDLVAAHADDGDAPRLIATFLGAHAVPPEFASDDAYVEYLVSECLPHAKAHGALYADIFCEPGFFSAEQARRYLGAAREHGLRLRAHCDEMAYGAAAATAVKVGVDAVDHCNCIGDDDVRAIIESGIVTVACPATIAYLELAHRVPVRRLLAGRASVALASDYNPGTSPCFNLQTVAYFGRALFGLSAAEALYGVTRAAARSLHIDAGVIRVGGAADLVALRIGSAEEFGWQFGGNAAAFVMRG